MDKKKLKEQLKTDMTLAEIAKEQGVSDRSVVWYALRSMAQKGEISKTYYVGWYQRKGKREGEKSWDKLTK